MNLPLYKIEISGIIISVAGSNTPGRHMEYAAVAHLVERHLAKVEVASSSLVARSTNEKGAMILLLFPYGDIAKW